MRDTLSPESRPWASFSYRLLLSHRVPSVWGPGDATGRHTSLGLVFSVQRGCVFVTSEVLGQQEDTVFLSLEWEEEGAVGEL